MLSQTEHPVPAWFKQTQYKTSIKYVASISDKLQQHIVQSSFLQISAMRKS
jgi:hypothetical protein